MLSSLDIRASQMDWRKLKATVCYRFLEAFLKKNQLLCRSKLTCLVRIKEGDQENRPGGQGAADGNPSMLV